MKVVPAMTIVSPALAPDSSVPPAVLFVIVNPALPSSDPVYTCKMSPLYMAPVIDDVREKDAVLEPVAMEIVSYAVFVLIAAESAFQN